MLTTADILEALKSLGRIADALEAQASFNQEWLAYDKERDARHHEHAQQDAEAHIGAEREVQKSCELLRSVEALRSLYQLGRYDDVIRLTGVDEQLAQLEAAKATQEE